MIGGNMDSALLKTFLVLAETKSFTAAAQKLFRSQSAISLQVIRLEKLIGKPLFIRNNRNVLLTLEGEQLIGYAKKILQTESEMLAHFDHPNLAGEITFGSPEDIATFFLPTILENFVELYPKISIHVNCEFTLDLLKKFDQGAYQLILIKEDPQNPHPKSEKLREESLVWVAKKGFEKTAEPLSLVLSPSPCVYRQRAIDALNQESIRWKIAYTSPSLAGTLAAVKAGLGVTVLPIEMVPKDLKILTHLPKPKNAQIALLKQETNSEAISAFASFIVETF
jgi:DNA-binding transcriptional LysR family regulator